MAKTAKKKTSRSSISLKWRKLFKLIPGYDPIKTAGDCWFDESAAEKVCSFFHSYIKHVKGAKAGQPFILEPWQQGYVGCLFGWKRKDGTRRYRESFLFVPRKNGKTVLAAGIVLYMMFIDGEPGAEIYSAAADREQAALIYYMAKEMVLHDPMMDAASRVYVTSKSIVVGSNTYKAISAEANTKHGYNTHLAVIDELHAQPNGELVDVLDTSTGARTQPMIIYLTTSDYERPSVCNRKYKYTVSVRDGTIEDETFLPCIFEAGIKDDWKDEKTWYKANPNLGISVSLEYIKKKCRQAQDDPEFENTFKRLHLNIRTEQDVRWLQMDRWNACDEEVLENCLVGRECFGGLDLASVEDIAAFALIFPATADDPMWRIIMRFWLPEIIARERQRKDGVPYPTWAGKGHITLTPGERVDYSIIKDQINADRSRFNLVDIGADRWNLEYLRQQLDPEGKLIVEYPQTFGGMSAPCKRFKSLIKSRSIAHGGNPVLTWNASNVVIDLDANENVKPNKKKSSEKIDGIVACIMAVGRAMVKETKSASIYEERGLLVV